MLVVPSIWPENSPLVIHEAFLAGVPVVASRIGGIPELVQDGVNGLLFEPGDADDLRARCSACSTNPRCSSDCVARGIPPVRIDRGRRAADARDVRSGTRADDVRANAASARLAAVVLNYRTPDETLLAVTSLLASRRPLDDHHRRRQRRWRGRAATALERLWRIGDVPRDRAAISGSPAG